MCPSKLNEEIEKGNNLVTKHMAGLHHIIIGTGWPKRVVIPQEPY